MDGGGGEYGVRLSPGVGTLPRAFQDKEHVYTSQTLLLRMRGSDSETSVHVVFFWLVMTLLSPPSPCHHASGTP